MVEEQENEKKRCSPPPAGLLLLIKNIPTMATKAVVGRGLREAGAALKHASGMEVCVIISFLFV